MASNLILPGQPSLTLDKDVQTMSRLTLQTLSRMHEVNRELGDIEVHCLRCGSSFQGANNDSPTETTFTVACNCRTLQFIK